MFKTYLRAIFVSHCKSEHHITAKQMREIKGRMAYEKGLCCLSKLKALETSVAHSMSDKMPDDGDYSLCIIQEYLIP